MEHRPGKQHLNADALSRSHCKQCGQCEQSKATGNNYPAVLAINTPEQGTLLPSWYMDDFQLQQQADSSLQQMINWLGNNSLPLSFPKHAHIEVQALWNQRHSLKLVDGILYRQWKDLPNGGVNAKLQLVILQHIISDVMNQVHDSPMGGHMGIAKTLEKLRQRFYWVKQRSTVEEWCKKCDLCNSRKSPPKKVCTTAANSD